MYQLIVFDWDGTLMDSAQKIANCIQAAARDLDLVVPDDRRAKSIIGLGLAEAMQRLFVNLSATQLSSLLEAYHHHFTIADDTQQGLFDGVITGLNSLNDAGVLLAVATGKSRAGLNRVFADIDIQHQFVATRCADETRSKPHPQMLYELLEVTAIDPQNTIMVGDTTYDMQMAANARVHGLGAAYGVHDKSELFAAQALDVKDTFIDIIDWLHDGKLSPAYESANQSD